MSFAHRKTGEAGAVGEKRVARILEDIPDSILLTNLLIPRRTGTSEIDAVVVNSKGIWVCEVKNYATNSIITGSLIRYEWTIRKKGVPSAKRKVYNPVRQNQAHIAALVRFLQSKGIRIQEAHCRSVIVFSSGCILKKVPTDKNLIITQEHLLRSVLNQRMRARKELLASDEVKAIAKTLRKTADATKSQKKRHIALAKEAERKRRDEQEKRRRARIRRKR